MKSWFAGVFLILVTRRHATPACVLDGWGHPKAVHATDILIQRVNTIGNNLYFYYTYMHISRDFYSACVVVNCPSSEHDS